MYNGFKSNTFIQTSGVPQGSILGPLLFNLYINDLSMCATHSEYLLYADDLKIYKTILTYADCELLQKDLTNINKWCISNGLSFNISKCKAVRYTRNKNQIDYNYSLNNTNIDQVMTFKDLGVIFDSKLNFSCHTDYIANAALKTLGFIMRNTRSFRNIEAIKSLFFALVRSKLEYCSTVWSPQYLNKIVCLENIQRRFLKILHFKHYHFYPARGTEQSELLHLFHIQSLISRREINDISFLFKLLNGFIDCPELLHQICYLTPSLRLRKSVLFRQPTPRTNIGKNCPLSRMCNYFNNVSDQCDIHNDKLRTIIDLIVARDDM